MKWQHDITVQMLSLKCIISLLDGSDQRVFCSRSIRDWVWVSPDLAAFSVTSMAFLASQPAAKQGLVRARLFSSFAPHDPRAEMGNKLHQQCT